MGALRDLITEEERQADWEAFKAKTVKGGSNGAGNGSAPHAEQKQAPAGDAKPVVWGEPQPIPEGLLPVTPMPPALVPEVFRGWLEDLATRMQVPLEFVAIPSIVVASSVIGSQIKIRPKRRDDWAVTPNLWGAVIGRPGVMKSPAILEAMKPVHDLCAEAAKKYAEEMEDWEFKKESRKAKQSAARKKMEAAAKDGKDLDEFKSAWTCSQDDEPTERRYIVNDATVEKLGVLLNQNPVGLLSFRDELTGLLRSLDDPQHYRDRGFYLEAWNGDGSYTYDRMERGKLHITNATLSVLGGIQPGPLQTYLRGALGYGEGDDGLLQRFQLIVYPDLPPEWAYVDDFPDEKAREAAHAVFGQLSKLSKLELVGAKRGSDNKPFLQFSEEAQEFFVAWYSDLCIDLRAGKFEHPALESHFSKYRSLMPALALIFELIDGAARAFEGFDGSVSIGSAKLAAAWCQFLMEHAHRVYGLALSAATLHAKTLARHLQKGDLPKEFKARDVYFKGWTGLSTAEAVAAPLELLEHLGWIRGAAITTGGRPTVIYTTNPKIKDIKL